MDPELLNQRYLNSLAPECAAPGEDSFPPPGPLKSNHASKRVTDTRRFIPKTCGSTSCKMLNTQSRANIQNESREPRLRVETQTNKFCLSWAQTGASAPCREQNRSPREHACGLGYRGGPRIARSLVPHSKCGPAAGTQRHYEQAARRESNASSLHQNKSTLIRRQFHATSG